MDGIGDEILDELQKTIDEKLGGSFEAHSFVVSSNTNVSAVQFVYVIDGVSEPDTEGDSGTGATEGSSSSDSAPSTIWGRLLALFS